MLTADQRERVTSALRRARDEGPKSWPAITGDLDREELRAFAAELLNREAWMEAEVGLLRGKLQTLGQRFEDMQKRMEVRS